MSDIDALELYERVNTHQMRTRSASSNELDNDSRPRKRMRRGDNEDNGGVVRRADDQQPDEQEEEPDEDEERPDEENEQGGEGEDPEKWQHQQTAVRRAERYGLNVEVPVRVEHLRAPYVPAKGKKGGFLPNPGATKKDFESPYPLLGLPFYDKMSCISWTKKDIAIHVGRRVEEIDWPALKWCYSSAARTSYTLIGTTADQWDKVITVWCTRSHGKVKEIALLVTFLSAPTPPNPDPAQIQEGNVELVAGKSNPLKGILDASSITWRQKLEDEHQIGTCPLHKTSRCVQRDGLHFILTFPMLNAWACYLRANPQASLKVPPPVPFFAASKAAKSHSNDSINASDSISQSGAQSEASKSSSEAIQIASLTLLAQLSTFMKPQTAPAVPPPLPPREERIYKPVASRYREAPSMQEFCHLYSLEASQVKYEALGIMPGDTPDDLDAVTSDDLKEHNLGSLEWKRLRNAVAEYWSPIDTQDADGR